MSVWKTIANNAITVKEKSTIKTRSARAKKEELFRKAIKNVKPIEAFDKKKGKKSKEEVEE